LSTLTAPSGQYSYAYKREYGESVRVITAPGNNTLSLHYDGFLPNEHDLERHLSRATSAGLTTVFFRTASQSVKRANTVNFAYDSDGLLTGAGSLRR